MPTPDDGAREQQHRRPEPERAPAGPTVEPAGPTELVPTVDARGTGGGMRETLEGMDAVSRHRMVSDMQRRSGNVAVQQVLKQQTAGQPAAAPARSDGQPAARADRSAAAGERESGERRDANRALLGSLLEHGSLGSSGAAAGRSGPAAAAGGGTESSATPPATPPLPPRFRPAGVGGDERPHDLTALAPAELDALLQRLWRDGVLRGDAERLAPLIVRVEALDRGGELRAFALLAALNERVAADALWQPLEAGTAGDPALAALWLAAGLWRSALVADVEAVDPAALHAAIEATVAAGDPRATAIVAWAALAEAELAIARGEAERGAELTGAVVDDPSAPAGAVIAAGLRAALLEAFVDPAQALARLATAQRRALAATAEADRVHVLVRRALLELIAGDGDAVGALLATVPGAAQVPDPTDRALADLLRALAPSAAATRRWVTEPVVEATRALAADGGAGGDYLLACGVVLACARAQRPVDPDGALATIIGGVATLVQAFGEGTARPLEAERDAIAAELGPERFRAAMRGAVQRSERALAPRTGPAAPPLP